MAIDEKAFEAFMLAVHEHGPTGLGHRKALAAYDAAKAAPSQDRVERVAIVLYGLEHQEKLDEPAEEVWGDLSECVKYPYLAQAKAILAALPQPEEVNAIKEWAAAKAAVDALPEDAYLDPAKMDALTAAIQRKNAAEERLRGIVKGEA